MTRGCKRYLSDLVDETYEAFAFELAIDPGDVLGGLAQAPPNPEVEFTDGTPRSMRRAEQRVIPQAKADTEQAYETQLSTALNASATSPSLYVQSPR